MVAENIYYHKIIIRGGVRFVEPSGLEVTVYILLDVEYLCYEIGLNYVKELCIKDFFLY